MTGSGGAERASPFFLRKIDRCFGAVYNRFVGKEVRDGETQGIESAIFG